MGAVNGGFYTLFEIGMGYDIDLLDTLSFQFLESILKNLVYALIGISAHFIIASSVYPACSASTIGVWGCLLRRCLTAHFRRWLINSSGWSCVLTKFGRQSRIKTLASISPM